MAEAAPGNPLQGVSFDSRGRAGQHDQDASSNSNNNSAPTAQVSDFLNQGTFDPARLHPLANLGQGLDYIILDEEKTNDLPGARTALPSRGWGDDLCYGTGTTYLGGLFVGGMWGVSEALRTPILGAASMAGKGGAADKGGLLGRAPVSPSMRLRINGLLNGMTRRGPFVGNSAAVLAMVYNIVNSTIGYYRGKHDTLNSVAAGAASGALFKSTRGVRPAMVAASMMASVAALWSAFKAAYL